MYCYYVIRDAVQYRTSPDGVYNYCPYYYEEGGDVQRPCDATKFNSEYEAIFKVQELVKYGGGYIIEKVYSV